MKKIESINQEKKSTKYDDESSEYDEDDYIYTIYAKNKEDLVKKMYENKDIYFNLLYSSSEPMYFVNYSPQDDSTLDNDIYIQTDQYAGSVFLKNDKIYLSKFSPYRSVGENLFTFNKDPKIFRKILNDKVNDKHKEITLQQFAYIVKFLSAEYSDDYGGTKLEIIYDNNNKYRINLNYLCH